MNHKLDIGSVFERIFATYGKQFPVLIGIALVIFVPVAIVNGLILADGTNVLGFAISTLVTWIGTYWYTGTVVLAAEDMLDGRRDHSIGSLLSSSAPFIPTLILAGLLAGIGITIGLILIVVPGLFLITIWAVIAPVIVLERVGVFESFGRSSELTKGNRWRVFGVLVLLFIITAVIGGIVSGIFRAIADSFVTIAIGDLLVHMFLGPLSALAAAILYFGLKQVRDGGVAPPSVDGPGPAAGGPESPVAPPPAGAAPPAAGAPQPPAPGGPPPQAPPPPPGQ
jgi:hypothetical protein